LHTNGQGMYRSAGAEYGREDREEESGEGSEQQPWKHGEKVSGAVRSTPILRLARTLHGCVEAVWMLGIESVLDALDPAKGILS